MKKKLKNYISYIDGLNIAGMQDEEKSVLRKEILVQIGFFQHERLVHLIVLVTIALLTLMSVFGCLVWPGILLFVLAGLLVVLLIPYIVHYYFLENGVQKLYEYYDMTMDKQ